MKKLIVAIVLATCIGILALPQLRKTAPAPTPPPLSVAILPFAAPAGSAAEEQFADAFTGAVLWRFDTAARTFAPPIGSGDTIYTADTDGVVRAFAPATTG